MTPFEKLVKHFGTETKAAHAIGVSQATVHNWKKGLHGIRAEHAIAAEKASEGAIKAYELCPALKGYAA